MKCTKCQREHNESSNLCSSCQNETVLLSEINNQSNGIEIDDSENLKKVSNDETVLLSQIENQSSDKEKNNANNQEKAKGNLPVNDILFDRYEIVSLLGKGGMGTVYLAKDLRLSGKYWAIKEVYLDKHQLEEFATEAKMLVDLEHPNLPKIIDYFTVKETGQTYLVMDYIKGQTLEEIYQKQNYEMSFSQVMKYSIQLCNLLDYLHSHKPTPIVYRDLKPSNVIIDEKDNVQLIDFGIARKYQEGKESDTVNIGTMGFAAPEQFESKQQTDHRTDLYSLGAMMYYLLSGGRFYISTQKPLKQLNPNLDNEVYDIVHKFLETDPNNRYQSAKEAKQDLLKQKVTAKLATTNSLEVVETEVAQKVKKVKKPKGTFKKKIKIFTFFLISLGILVGAAFGSYKYFVNEESEEKLIETFENAIAEKDYATLVQIIDSPDKRLSLNEDNIKPFVSYFEQNPQNFSAMIRQLNNESIYTNNDEQILKVVEAEKKYYVIPTYKFEIVPSYVSVHTNRLNAVINMNGNEVAVADEETFVKNIGPLVPGSYEIEAIWDAQYMTLKVKQSVDLFSDEGTNQLVELDLTGETISVSSNYADAKLFVDNVDTGLIIDEAKVFGPIITDGSMSIHAEKEFPWGTVKSPTIKIKDTDSVLLTIDEFSGDLQNTITEFGKQYSTEIMNLIKSNTLANIQPKFATNSHHTNLVEEIHAKSGVVVPEKVLFDLDTFDYVEGNNKEAIVHYNQKIMFSVQVNNENGEAENIPYELTEKVSLLYKPEENSWEMTSIMPTVTFNSQNIVEIPLGP